MSFSLGASPLPMSVRLSTGADFVATMRRESGNWDVGTNITLRFGDVEWDATIVDDEARWNVDKAQVDALIATSPRRVHLDYVNGSADALWAIGSVVVYA